MIYIDPYLYVSIYAYLQQITTNGQYRSNLHRAIVHTETDRISLAGFHSSRVDATIGPLPEIVKGGKEHYETMPSERYYMAYFAKQYGKSHVESAKVEK